MFEPGAPNHPASGSNLHIPVLPDAMQPGQAVTLGIRPETLQPQPDGLLRGEVRLVEHLGASHCCTSVPNTMAR